MKINLPVLVMLGCAGFAMVCGQNGDMPCVYIAAGVFVIALIRVILVGDDDEVGRP